MLNSDLHALDSANTRPVQKAAMVGHGFNPALLERYGHVALSSKRIITGVMMIAVLAISGTEICYIQENVNSLKITQTVAQFIPDAFYNVNSTTVIYAG